MALINVAINFGYEYFCFVIYFSEIFFVKTFFQNFPKFIFQHFFSKFFPEIFFSKFFSQNFFFKIFSPNFFPKIFLKKFFLRALPSFTETRRTLCICVMKNMIHSKRSKLDFSLV